MYFDDVPGAVFRPPGEANSFILRVTSGCSHNRCTFCCMYKDVNFSIRPLPEIERQIARAARFGQQVRRVFLADGDALALPTDVLLAILARLKATFPRLQRVASYAGPKNLLHKTPEELSRLRAAGLKLLYYGLESGDDEVLAYVNKGVSASQAVLAGQKAVTAGFRLSLMVILGLGGCRWTKQHAEHTAQAVSAIAPQLLNALTLMLYPGAALTAEYEAGRFTPLSPSELAGELAQLLEAIVLPEGRHCLFRCDHVSNYIPINGVLPGDQACLAEEARAAQSELEKLPDWDPYNDVDG